MNDIDLIEKVKANDEKAFEEIVNKYRPMIFSIINKSQIKFDNFHISKEDLYQESCISLYEACKRYNPKRKAKFSSFAYRLMSCRVNKLFYKSNKIIKNEINILDSLEEDDRVAFVSDTEFTYETQFARYNFYETISYLSKEDKTIIQMRIDNYSYKEIADRLNITTKRVDNRLSKLKQKIRNRKI